METSLNALVFCLKSVEVFVILCVIVIGVDLGIYEFKNTTKTKQTKQTKESTMTIVKNALRALLRGLALFLSEAQARVIKPRQEEKTTGRHRPDAAKARIRAAKEKSAHEGWHKGFFEDSYVRGFDVSGELFHRPMVATAPYDGYYKYYKKMDELADTEIFLNTEEI